MGISNAASGCVLVIAGAAPAEAATVMQWDLVHPWSRIYELQSTHPLTAFRVQALNAEAESRHQVPKFPLAVNPHVDFSEFPLQFGLWLAPWIFGAAFLAISIASRSISFLGFTLPPKTEPLLLIALVIAWIAKNVYRYSGEFQDATIGELIRNLEVSEMKPRAVRLRGKILGRGLPGAFWSPDLVLQDPSGILFLLYRQSIPFAR
jgi:heat shock protein HtpX